MNTNKLSYVRAQVSFIVWYRMTYARPRQCVACLPCCVQGPDAKRLKTESYLVALKQALSEESFAMFKVLLQAYSKVHGFCVQVLQIHHT